MNAGNALMSEAQRYVVVAVDEHRLAIALEQVVRVVHAVEVTTLPDVSPVVAGYVNVHGEFVPVIDLRRRLGLPERDLVLSDQFVLVHGGGMRALVIADGVVGVVELASESFVPRPRPYAVDDCRGADLDLEEGTISVLALDRLLASEAAERVRSALAALRDR